MSYGVWDRRIMAQPDVEHDYTCETWGLVSQHRNGTNVLVFRFAKLY